jgi:4-diphosphocytidyl-2-C-methyl-D-erythritol kinase
VSEKLAETARAKINLTLRVLGRRKDGYHELESLVVFADLADRLELEPAGSESLAVAGTFAASCATGPDNLVLKAASALRERVEHLKSGRLILDKQLPVAAGIGGGSADAAAALRLLARLNGIAADDPRLRAAALAVGADVPVCLDGAARVMRGVGDILSEPLTMPTLAAVLANPGVPLATCAVFQAFAGSKGGEVHLPDLPHEAEALIDVLDRHGNDLTQAAIACAPVVADVLTALRALPGAWLVRMSGSGPTCFALFRSSGEAKVAALRLQVERKNWWVQAAKFG